MNTPSKTRFDGNSLPKQVTPDSENHASLSSRGAAIPCGSGCSGGFRPPWRPWSGGFARGLVARIMAFLLGTAALAAGQTFTGNLNVNGHPTEVIPITLSQDGTLSLQITVSANLNLNSNSSVGVTQGVIVYDSTGINQLYGALQGQGTTLTHVVNGLGAGNYSVRLTAIGYVPSLGAGAYSMIASETPDPLVNDAEPNDDFDHSLTTPLSSQITGHLGYLGPQSVIETQDYWQVALPTDGTLHLDIITGARLNLNANPGLGTSGGIMVYDADRSTSFYTTSQGENTTRMHSIPKLKAGVYYVRLVVIGTHTGYYGSYRMTARHTPESVANDSEPNDQAGNFGMLALDTPATGHLGYYGGGAGAATDVLDWWRVTLPHAGNLQLEITTSAVLNLSGGIKVYDSDAATVFFTNVQAENTTKTHTAQQLKPGVYYVSLKRIDSAGYYGGYTLTPRLITVPEDPELNDDAAGAGNASLGTTAQGNLGYLGGGLGSTNDQQDWWKITLPSAGKLQLVIQTSDSLNLNRNNIVGVTQGVLLYPIAAGGGLAPPIINTSQGQGTTQTYPQLNLAAGSYYLRLVKLTDGGDNYWGTYSVALNYVGPPVINSPAISRLLIDRTGNYTITAAGGGPYTFGAAGLPAGFSVDPNSGLITGTLGAPGTYQVTLSATSPTGTTTTPMTLIVQPMPTLTIQTQPSNQIVLAWLADYPDFTLKTSTSLTNSTWTAVTPAPVIIGDSFVGTYAKDRASRFYRLEQP